MLYFIFRLKRVVATGKYVRSDSFLPNGEPDQCYTYLSENGQSYYLSNKSQTGKGTTIFLTVGRGRHHSRGKDDPTQFPGNKIKK